MCGSVQQFILMNMLPCGLPYYAIIFVDNVINFMVYAHGKFEFSFDQAADSSIDEETHLLRNNYFEPKV